MKKVTIILLLLITKISFGQNFEGTLTYTTDIQISEKMKEMGLTKEILIEKMVEENSFSSKVKYIYKNDNYVIEMVDNQTTSTYIGEKNTIYTRVKNDDFIIAIDASIDLENKMFGTPPTIERMDTDVVILDKKCSKVVVTWKAGVYEYYYATDFLKIDPNLYKNHKYDMWFEFLKISNALPLRIVKKTGGMMTLIMNLVDVKESKIDMTKFELPKMKLDNEMSKYVLKNQSVYKIK